jgi:2-hydroxy-6-oxonona-2,4-dienedioate hydrolase
MRVHFADIRGVSTRFFRAGKGPSVVLLHGVGLTADSWFKTIGPLSQEFDVLAPDLLDNGFTARGVYESGAPHLAMLDHLEALLDALNLATVAVVGSSFGAALAVLLYLRLPKRVNRLVLVSSGSVFRTANALVSGYKKSYSNGRQALEDPTLETCKKRLGELFYDPRRIPTELLLLQLTPYALPTALPSFERRLRGMMDVDAMRQFEIGDRLKDITVPLLGVWGKQDPRGDYEQAREVFNKLPHAQLVAFEQCGHLPHLEHEDQFNKVVREFLHS